MKQFFKKKNDNIITFKTSSLKLKIFNVIIGLFILGSNIIGITNNNYSIVAIIIGVLCIILACYRNSWIFHIDNKIVLNKKGILFFSKKAKYNFSEISAILIEKYNRAGRKSEYTEISIQFKDGEKFIIESDKTKKLKEQILIAEALQQIVLT